MELKFVSGLLPRSARPGEEKRDIGMQSARARVTFGGLVESWAAIKAEEPTSHLSGSYYSG